MIKTRLEILEEMVTEDEKNTFARYGLAQEYLSSGRLEDAAAQFARLAEINPDYSPAYFHGGRTLERLGRAEDARTMYRRGLEACQRSGNAHALSEMQAALDQLR